MSICPLGKDEASSAKWQDLLLYIFEIDFLFSLWVFIVLKTWCHIYLFLAVGSCLGQCT